MKITAQFNDKAPVELDGVWRLVIEDRDESYEIIPQMVDRGELRMLIRANGISDQLLIVPHGSNSIRFGVKK
jgi:hypothetical protein